jgi:DNA-binding MarR family transcriptional regulator
MSTQSPKQPADLDRDTQIERIGDSMAKIRLMTGRRYISRITIARMGGGMELSHLDVMLLVRRLGAEQEVTIGALAEQMHLDHSRASRIVAELVKRGELRREASQEDARRTIVALTEQGKVHLQQMHAVKQGIMTEALAEWSENDITDFARLYAKFTRTMMDQAAAFESETTDNK